MAAVTEPGQMEAVAPIAAAPFTALLRQRRSVRRYCARPVPRETLRELVDAATRAPSNFNRQPWQFVVMDEPPWIAALFGLLDRGVDIMERQDSAGELFNLLDHVRRWQCPLRDCAALVLAFYKPSPETLDRQALRILEGGDVGLYNPNLVSLGMAIQNLLLAAQARGLGACMHSGPLAFVRGELNRLLDLPARLELAGLITLGWPDEQPAAPSHRDLDRVLQFCQGPVPPQWAATRREGQGA